MSLHTLEQGFILLSGYLEFLNEKKEINERVLRESFNGLIKMCEGDSFNNQAKRLKTLLTIIIKQKEVTQRNIYTLNQIRKSID